jgi:hypothetical protein
MDNSSKFFGLLKSEDDIVYHFGFEGLDGYREYLKAMEPYDILYAALEELFPGIPIPAFAMVVRRKDAQTSDSGLFSVATLLQSVDPSNLQFAPQTVESLREMSSGEMGEVAPEGFVDFVNNTFPIQTTVFPPATVTSRSRCGGVVTQAAA